MTKELKTFTLYDGDGVFDEFPVTEEQEQAIIEQIEEDGGRFSVELATLIAIINEENMGKKFG